MITSSSNIQIKNLIQLKKKSKERSRQDVFLAEGVKMFREVPRERLQKVYVSAGFSEDPKHREFLSNVDHEVVSDSVFDAISDTRTPQGMWYWKICRIREIWERYFVQRRGQASPGSF